MAQAAHLVAAGRQLREVGAQRARLRGDGVEGDFRGVGLALPLRRSVVGVDVVLVVLAEGQDGLDVAFREGIHRRRVVSFPAVPASFPTTGGRQQDPGACRNNGTFHEATDRIATQSMSRHVSFLAGSLPEEPSSIPPAVSRRARDRRDRDWRRPDRLRLRVVVCRRRHQDSRPRGGSDRWRQHGGVGRVDPRGLRRLVPGRRPERTASARPGRCGRGCDAPRWTSRRRSSGRTSGAISCRRTCCTWCGGTRTPSGGCGASMMRVARRASITRWMTAAALAQGGIPRRRRRHPHARLRVRSVSRLPGLRGSGGRLAAPCSSSGHPCDAFAPAASASRSPPGRARCERRRSSLPPAPRSPISARSAAISIRSRATPSSPSRCLRRSGASSAGAPPRCATARARRTSCAG